MINPQKTVVGNAAMKINPNAIVRELDGDFVVLTAETGYIHHLNETASEILEMIEGCMNQDEIVDFIYHEVGSHPNLIYESVENCIKELTQKRIIIYDETP